MKLGRALGTAALLVAGLAPLAACGSGGGGGSTEVVDAVASFYPLQYVTERVGGPYVKVTNLTAPGAEPHDLELTARDLAHVSDADLVVYLRSFSAAVDSAVDAEAGDRALDVGAAARLIEGDADGGTTNDPHFWLDPTRLADVADVVRDRLADRRPDVAATFAANAAALRADLEALDAEYRAGLATCDSRDLVTSHAAFGYLAARYDLTQIGITGLEPEAEPTPAALAEVASFVRSRGVRTVYTETLVSPALAETLASETGAHVAVLDPLEGLAAGSTGDFLQVMRVNLATLREGQGCR